MITGGVKDSVPGLNLSKKLFLNLNSKIIGAMNTHRIEKESILEPDIILKIFTMTTLNTTVRSLSSTFAFKNV